MSKYVNNAYLLFSCMTAMHFALSMKLLKLGKSSMQDLNDVAGNIHLNTFTIMCSFVEGKTAFRYDLYF